MKTISFFAPTFWGRWTKIEIVILMREFSQTLPLQTPSIIRLDHNIVSSRHDFRRLLWKIKICFSNIMVPWNNQVNFIFCIKSMGTLQRFKAFKVHHDVCSKFSLAITWLIHLKYLQIITTGLWYNKPILVRHYILHENDIVFCTDILGTLNWIQNCDIKTRILSNLATADSKNYSTRSQFVSSENSACYYVDIILNDWLTNKRKIFKCQWKIYFYFLYQHCWDIVTSLGLQSTSGFCCDIFVAINGMIHLNHLQIFTMGLWYGKRYSRSQF